MKNQIIVILCFLIGMLKVYSESKLFVQPDILFFPDSSNTMVLDTLLIANLGASNLQIDSIKNNRMYIYDVVGISDPGMHWFPIFSTEYYRDDAFSTLVVHPQDTLMLGVYSPELCPICKEMNRNYYFTDSLFIYSNDTTRFPYVITAFGWSHMAKVEEIIYPEENDIILEANYPNPFNNRTVISYRLSKQAYVQLSILDITGKVVLSLINDYEPRGIHEIVWSGTNSQGDTVSSGIYYLLLKVDDFSSVRKMMYIK